jgi:zinc transporter, ZIP family
MGALDALFWGGLGASSLVLGGVIDLRTRPPTRLVGLLLAFGAGTLISAVAYELVPSERGFPIGVAVTLGIGAVVFYVVDAVVDGMGGAGRKSIGAVATPDTPAGSGSAIAIGTLLDGIPESVVLGIGLSMGGSVSVAFLVAVFVSNLPEAIGGSDALRAAGRSPSRILWLWIAILVASALAAAGGYVLASAFSLSGELVQAFAAGAMITMVADTMLPEAFAKGGKQAGLMTALGFTIAALLSALE